MEPIDTDDFCEMRRTVYHKLKPFKFFVTSLYHANGWHGKRIVVCNLLSADIRDYVEEVRIAWKDE